MPRYKSNKSGKNKSTGTDQKFKFKVLDLFTKHPERKLGFFQILKKLKSKHADGLMVVLNHLVNEKMIKLNDQGKYEILSKIHSAAGETKTYSGYVDMARAGFAYVICKEEAQDIYVSQKNLKGAEDGDFVMVELIRLFKAKPEGQVIEVLNRSRSQYIGIVKFHNNRPSVFTQSGPKLLEIPVEIPKDISVEEFDRVVMEITHWKEKPGDRTMGKVIKNLGRETSIDVEMQSILADKGFPLDWTSTLLEDAKRISNEMILHSYRKDFRQITTFTIDPYDAKDFDDAISFRYLENGNIEIGIHIADVSHYVKENSPMDKEALKRGNSVYLVDRVLPMLPERLSNELCSLRPNEDKYTFSVVFEMNSFFDIVNHWIGKTMIHSKRRFHYEEVQEILNGTKDPLKKELVKINTIAKQYRLNRIDVGSIDFDSEEVKFKLDDKGNPIELNVKARLDAHMLIEEFMLLANKYVALYISKKDKVKTIPFVYRVHDKPDPDKLEEFGNFANEMGVKLDLSSPKKISKSLNKLAEMARENDNLKILAPLAIRTMAKAEYSVDNIGHYGLAFPYYSHFTSPIRRYADLIAHRILFANLQGELRVNSKILESQCMYISNQERKAMEAERDSVRFFQVLFMKSRVGDEFDGRIRGMNERGFYIDLTGTQCEGFLPIENLDEELTFKPGRMAAHSLHSKQTWKIGDKIKVKLLAADIEDKELLLGLAT